MAENSGPRRHRTLLFGNRAGSEARWSGCETRKAWVRASNSRGLRSGGLAQAAAATGVSSPVAVEREAVDHEGVAQEVEELALVADAVGSAEPEGVVEVAVDGLGVVAAG